MLFVGNPPHPCLLRPGTRGHQPQVHGTCMGRFFFLVTSETRRQPALSTCAYVPGLEVEVNLAALCLLFPMQHVSNNKPRVYPIYAVLRCISPCFSWFLACVVPAWQVPTSYIIPRRETKGSAGQFLWQHPPRAALYLYPLQWRAMGKRARAQPRACRNRC